ncbi:MAG TPA: RIP metalloprotease RseP [Longimicrobiales bacterium]|nr:RIP metalloprotease RseP [Longimicrobiales bacterium]
MLITLLATVVVLGVLIFVHELGHFMAAKAMDIEVPRFSIGLGPKMIGFTRGETEYVISWLPLGGYVKMAGMEEMDAIEGGPSNKPVISGAITADDTGLEVEDKRVAGPRDFESKSLPARTLVISAGVIMNIIFAFLVFTISSWIWGVRVSPEARVGAVAEEYLPHGAEALASIPSGTRITAVGKTPVKTMRDVQVAIAKVSPGDLTFTFENQAPIIIKLQPGDSVRQSLVDAINPSVMTPPIVGEVGKNSAAAKGGMQAGDKVVSAAGQPLKSWQQLVSVIEKHGGKQLPLVVDRKGQQVSLTVVPEAKTERGMTYGRLGISSSVTADDAIPRQRPGLFGGFAQGATQTWDVVRLTAGFLWDLVSGGASPRNLGGPILIGKLSGQVARAGFEAFISFMALFSVNLAVLNLLPIPVLDGGHLMFLLAEAVRGKALSLESRMRLSQVGFVIVVAIMVWAVANDVLRLFGL